MSTVGLTKAQDRALRYLDGNRRMMEHLFDAGLIAWNNTGGGQDGWYHTPRGHAALAAPRMTHGQFQWLCFLEAVHCARPRGSDRATDKNMRSAGFVEVRDDGFSVLTPAGRTALNNVRAAMGSPDWKENV